MDLRCPGVERPASASVDTETTERMNVLLFLWLLLSSFILVSLLPALTSKILLSYHKLQTCKVSSDLQIDFSLLYEPVEQMALEST